jgi:hypothetical protein
MYENHGHRLINVLTLPERLKQLSLRDMLEVTNLLGICTDNLNSVQGNTSSWPLDGQIMYQVLNRNLGCKLNSLLLSIEDRLGLKSPNHTPWPIIIDIDVSVNIGNNYTYWYGKCEDIPGLNLFSAASFEDMVNSAREVVERIIEYKWGLNIKTINETTTPNFDCLEINYTKFSVYTRYENIFDEYVRVIRDNLYINTLPIIGDQVCLSEDTNGEKKTKPDDGVCPVCHSKTRRIPCKACNPENT